MPDSNPGVACLTPIQESLQEALHKNVNVKIEVEDVEVVLKSVIGVKQGDLLGPQLFIFYICAIMMAWRLEREHNKEYELCTYQTKMDAVACTRPWDEGLLRRRAAELGSAKD